MFCQSCRYPLHSLANPICPECGRAFNPHAPSTYFTNTDRPMLPTSLKVIAILFIIGGAFDTLDMVFALFRSTIKINFGFLGLFIGPGLLALKPGWRTCALVFIWMGMIFIPIFVILLMVSNAPLNFNVLGVSVARLAKFLGLIVAALFFAFIYWQYHILTRPDIRALFRLPPRY